MERPLVAELERILRAHAWNSTERFRPSRGERPKAEAGAIQSPVSGPFAERSLLMLEGPEAPQKGERMECSLAELEQILRGRICHVCSDRREDGTCGLENPADCAIFRYLPEVARAVQSTESVDIKDYVRALRSQVCSICSKQGADGSCELRDQVRCALDAYLIFIVDTIEEATGKRWSRQAAWCSR
jgi:hypothetical protein